MALKRECLVSSYFQQGDFPDPFHLRPNTILHLAFIFLHSHILGQKESVIVSETVLSKVYGVIESFCKGRNWHSFGEFLSISIKHLLLPDPNQILY